MPIYEYQCSSCGHQLEAFQNMSDQPLLNCPACHHDTLSKLISSTSFQLKGTGWYATDFRDKGKSKPDEKKDTQTEPTQSTDSKKTETTKPNKPTDSTAA